MILIEIKSKTSIATDLHAMTHEHVGTNNLNKQTHYLELTVLSETGTFWIWHRMLSSLNGTLWSGNGMTPNHEQNSMIHWCCRVLQCLYHQSRFLCIRFILALRRRG